MNNILSELTVFSKYAKYIPELQRRETWDEICLRYQTMMCRKYPELTQEIEDNMDYIKTKQILPSMRALQFSGPAMERNPARGYNCAYLPIDDTRAFSEAMFLLLTGCGVGYSVQYHHVDKLPEIRKASKTKRYLIGDSIEGWSDAVKVLMKAYLGLQPWKPLFDYSDIRPKGARLVTSGGKAPGPNILRVCLAHIEAILDTKAETTKLEPIEVHSIMCHIANAVLAGGIRRAAMIALFSFDDDKMLTCKYGNWWELNEQFGRANNSAVIQRSRITEEEFDGLWVKIQNSNAGEPGIYFTNDIEYGTNPCCEIALRPFSFCNLTELNVETITSQEHLNKIAKVAAFFGTLQAGFIDFHYLRDVWKRTTEKDALIGVGMTGIASGSVLNYDLNKSAKTVKEENIRVANLIGINKASRTTTIKPSGTTSCVLGTSSGIHAYHAPFYLRTLRFNKDEEIAKYLMINNPELCEDDILRPHDTICVRIPQYSPVSALSRKSETALSLLDRVARFNQEWVKSGHRTGSNTNNVSATISINKDNLYYFDNRMQNYGLVNVIRDDVNLNQFYTEWEVVGKWMWKNRANFNGLSVLPMDNGTYKQAPFEEITEEEYYQKVSQINPIDLTKVIETDDETEHTQEAACAGGLCSI